MYNRSTGYVLQKKSVSHFIIFDISKVVYLLGYRSFWCIHYIDGHYVIHKKMVRTPLVKIIVYGHLVGFDPTSLDLKGRCSSAELQMHMV